MQTIVVALEAAEEEVGSEAETLVVVVEADLVTEGTPGLGAVVVVLGLTTEDPDSAAVGETAGLVGDITAAATIRRRDLETPAGAVAIAVPVEPQLAVVVQEGAGISRKALEIHSRRDLGTHRINNLVVEIWDNLEIQIHHLLAIHLEETWVGHQAIWVAQQEGVELPDREWAVAGAQLGPRA